jgi:hypothetical protein
MPLGLMSGTAFQALQPRDLFALLRHHPPQLSATSPSSLTTRAFSSDGDSPSDLNRGTLIQVESEPAASRESKSRSPPGFLPGYISAPQLLSFTRIWTAIPLRRRADTGALHVESNRKATPRQPDLDNVGCSSPLRLIPTSRASTSTATMRTTNFVTNCARRLQLSGASRKEICHIGRMQVFTFRSTKDANLFGFTTDSSGRNLPIALGPWKPDGQAMPLGGDVSGLNCQAIVDGIRTDGFYVTKGGPTTVTQEHESWTPEE